MEKPTDVHPIDPGGRPDGPTVTASDTPPDRRDLIEGYLAYFPELRSKIIRHLLLMLHNRGVKDVDAIYDEAREALSGEAPSPDDGLEDDDEEDDAGDAPDGETGDHPGINRGMAHRWNADERREIDRLVTQYAADSFTAGELDAVVLLTRKRREAENLNLFANDAGLPVNELAEKVAEYCELPGRWVRLPKAEAFGLRVTLLRRVISEQLDFLGVAKHHMTVRDANRILTNSVGTEGGSGRVGGKAAGMVLAAAILRDAAAAGHEEWPFRTPESLFVRTDVFQRFLRVNDLIEYTDQKYKDIDQVRSEFGAVREVFKNAEFPEDVVKQIRAFLERIGPHPLIVRSSSLLEDNFNYAFSGKYASIFLGNQGDLEDRLHQLLGAIAEVFASTLGPDPIAYRRAKNLIDYDELMGVIIQKVVGKRHGRFFFPAWAGVAFSHNEYRWNPRIRKEDGLVRLVMGLGSRAVDRVGGDYPRMIALGMPTLRPEGNVQDACRYSQRYLDVIDLKRNEFRCVSLDRILAEGPYPLLHDIVSIHRDGDLIPPVTKRITESPENLIVTFDNLLARSEFVPRLRWMLESIARAYDRPVDVEFAFDGQDFYVLQCRPLSSRIEMSDVQIPANVPETDQIFSARSDVATADLAQVEYIVYVDPVRYTALASAADCHTVTAAVGHLNAALEGKRYILMGPGRWGSSDHRLGVRVTYADINHTLLLIEIARAREGYEPDVSFGTHFFQDLVEAGIQHLPLYPDRAEVVFNEAFLRDSENRLTSLVPSASDLTDIVRVIHVPSASGGRSLRIMMDGKKDEALAFLESPA